MSASEGQSGLERVCECPEEKTGVLGFCRVAVATAGQAWRCTPVIPPIKKLKQEDSKFEASLGCIVRYHSLPSTYPTPPKRTTKPQKGWVQGTISVPVQSTGRAERMSRVSKQLLRDKTGVLQRVGWGGPGKVTGEGG